MDGRFVRRVVEGNNEEAQAEHIGGYIEICVEDKVRRGIVEV